MKIPELLACGRRWLWALSFFSAAVAAQSQGSVGYVGWWLPDGWKSVQHVKFDRLFIFELPISDSGEIADLHGWPDRWSELFEHARTHDIPVDVTVTLMDLRRFHHVFGDPKLVERLETQLKMLATDVRTSGVQLDVEFYDEASPSAIHAYRQFVQKLAYQLKSMQPPRQLGVFLPFQSRSLLYDADTLRSIDYVVVQGYDAHWLESKNAGPVAPLDGPYALTWKKAVALSDSLDVSRNKQYISFPLYGYEWRVREAKHPHAATLGKGLTTTFVDLRSPRSTQQQFPPEVNVGERVARYGSAYDATSGSSNYRFKGNDGYWREGWFDDWWGVNSKTQFAQESGLAGLAFFLLGYDGGVLVEHHQRQIRKVLPRTSP